MKSLQSPPTQGQGCLVGNELVWVCPHSRTLSGGLRPSSARETPHPCPPPSPRHQETGAVRCVLTAQSGPTATCPLPLKLTPVGFQRSRQDSRERPRGAASSQNNLTAVPGHLQRGGVPEPRAAPLSPHGLGAGNEDGARGRDTERGAWRSRVREEAEAGGGGGSEPCQHPQASGPPEDRGAAPRSWCGGWLSRRRGRVEKQGQALAPRDRSGPHRAYLLGAPHFPRWDTGTERPGACPRTPAYEWQARTRLARRLSLSGLHTLGHHPPSWPAG